MRHIDPLLTISTFPIDIIGRDYLILYHRKCTSFPLILVPPTWNVPFTPLNILRFIIDYRWFKTGTIHIGSSSISHKLLDSQ